jgi:hypothetical protein
MELEYFVLLIKEQKSRRVLQKGFFWAPYLFEKYD